MNFQVDFERFLGPPRAPPGHPKMSQKRVKSQTRLRGASGGSFWSHFGFILEPPGVHFRASGGRFSSVRGGSRRLRILIFHFGGRWRNEDLLRSPLFLFPRSSSSSFSFACVGILGLSVGRFSVHFLAHPRGQRLQRSLLKPLSGGAERAREA